jgi:ABC-type sugar transport system ATPase subunit
VARIDLCNLNKSFGSVKAVKNLNITIDDGEFVVLVGPSGCGKTTTLRMIAGFEDPTSGEIRIDGHIVNDLEPRDRGLGMVFQSHALFPHKNVAQNIEFGLRMKDVPAPERVRRVREVAEMVHIAHLLDKMPAQCSGGESQRVTHDQEEAMTLADRIVVMRSGEIEQVGSPMNIYSDPVSYFVADFFGSPSMNLVAGEIIYDNDVARFRSARFEFALPEHFKTIKPSAVTLGIRPEHVGVAFGGKGEIALPVRLVEPLGKDTLLYFDDGTERAFVAVSEGLEMADVKSGARITLSFDPRRLYLFDADGRRIGAAT